MLEKKENLLTGLTPQNKEIEILDQKIDARIVSIRKSLIIIEERVKESMALLQGKILELESEYYKLPETIMRYDRLKYIEELNNKYFTLFTEKKIEYTLSNAGYSSTNESLVIQLSPKTP